MVTTLYLIRHGETQGAETRRYKGTIDVPLSENGVKQMEKLAGYLSQITIHESDATRLKAVYTSDLSRAIKSAEIIAKPHSLKPIIVSSLRERNFGLWEGMSFDEGACRGYKKYFETKSVATLSKYQGFKVKKGGDERSALKMKSIRSI
jgi:broad specificity phosphatase PhoE